MSATALGPPEAEGTLEQANGSDGRPSQRRPQDPNEVSAYFERYWRDSLERLRRHLEGGDDERARCVSDDPVKPPG